jgi:hypothetical protein
MEAAALRLLLQRLDLDPPRLHMEEAWDVLGASLEPLVACGLLRETAPSRFTTCWECGGSRTIQVIHLSRPGSPERVPFLPCPQCGPVRIDPEQLRRWDIDVPAFAGALTAAAGVAGPPAEVIPRRLWRLGKAKWAERPHDAYLARYLSDESVPAVAAALSRVPKAVLFLPTEEAVRAWARSLPTLALALESVLGPGEGGMLFDRAYLEARLENAGLVAREKSERRPRKRRDRAAKIEQLEQVLEQHLLAARDHAWATMDRAGAPTLLLRPTQKDLAKQTGLSEPDVSRCLSDPAGKYLRFLWETALHLDEVLRWEARRRWRRPR